ncbi:transcriptional regulator, TetR family [Clostridium cavendishii DSM 21758]|uniref:Transcriptional regulator, TetR family n=1 Tax=Clostridium cavendishii DSM 21758 TaxID=1121302 RepID=A0A1M6T3M7_9CLOT|nr:TetR/AcrR family transcriptional regulator [Clostridium cavendishii]SHK51557.1 transcriptional regulator, TetR family [Clostridium cavendishii DSM 21758]
MVIINGYEKRTRQKREVILETAVEMFFNNGVKNTSVFDIAKKAKVSKVTIFKYFENKENLVRESMNKYFTNYLENELKILTSNETFMKKIEILLSITKDSTDMLKTDIFSSDIWNDSLMQQIYNELTQKAMPYIIDFFEQGKREGILDKSLPTEALLAFLSTWASLANPGSREVSKEYILGINKLFFFGLFGGKEEVKDNKNLFEFFR